MTDPTVNLPEKHGSVVDLFLNLMIWFNLIIHPSIPIFENGTNSAAMLFRKINSGICREVSLKPSYYSQVKGFCKHLHHHMILQQLKKRSFTKSIQRCVRIVTELVSNANDGLSLHKLYCLFVWGITFDYAITDYIISDYAHCTGNLFGRLCLYISFTFWCGR